MKRLKVLGIACSLRNARWGFGSESLKTSLTQIKSEEELSDFLQKESDQHLENFMEAGRKDGQDFSTIYRNLKRQKGTTGLSNSEIMLAAALWSVSQFDIDIEHLSLAEYFTADGSLKKPEQLMQKLLSSDALLISGPVYFGDRGSLAESLIHFIRQNPVITTHLKGKLYAGLSVGAKRNGGQETALIYQMFDMLDLGLLAVGNDSETTAQYGGTGHAGDVGTMHKDQYGLQTAMGTGRRIARVLHLMNTKGSLKTKLKALIIILRENQELAHKTIKSIEPVLHNYTDFKVIDVTSSHIQRCIACDICPTSVAQDSMYRCIIKSKRDDLESLHQELLSHDLIIPIVADTQSQENISSNYQQFIERTRYLRRGDYVFGDQLVIPILATEVGVKSTYLMRLTTSFIRHHTIISRPLEQLYMNGNPLNHLQDELESAFIEAERLTIGRLTRARDEHIEDIDRCYNPVGYILSAHKAQEDSLLGTREILVSDRQEKLALEAKKRLN